MQPQTFDCVRLKDEIQARMAQAYRGLDDEARRSRIMRELEEGDDPVSRKWRLLTRERVPAGAPVTRA